MKRLFTLLTTLLVGACLSFAAVPQNTGGSKADTGKKGAEADTGKKEHKGGKKGHKGGKKSKKGAGDTGTTPPPK